LVPLASPFFRASENEVSEPVFRPAGVGQMTPSGKCVSMNSGKLKSTPTSTSKVPRVMIPVPALMPTLIPAR